MKQPIKHKMHVFVGTHAWCVRFTDPQITEIMGTDTIPTPYLLRVDKDKVIAELQRLNPEYEVY